MSTALDDTIVSVDPSTGTSTPTTLHITSDDEVGRICARAAAAFEAFDAVGRSGRARYLREIADELEARREDIVAVTRSETGLPTARLNGELTRTAYQMRLFADVLDDGAYVEATIDHAGDTPMGPGPDLRRMLVPLGPVAVFGASNFPLAFSVPGGDTASALAAGNPVVVKAHSSHPLTSALCFEVLETAARRTSMPDGVVGLVFGQSAGAALVADPRIKAVGFTGSLGGGRALMSIIDGREEPIPFYGELASINPLVVTPGAASARASEIAAGFVTSITGSGGQLCTKPGLAFVPSGADGDRLVEAVAEALSGVEAPVLLNRRIAESFDDISSRATSGCTALQGIPSSGEGYRATATVLTVHAGDLGTAVTEECFGPFAVIARYDSERQLTEALDTVPGSLTGTVHSDSAETELTATISAALRPKAGRLLYNGFPTGVLVSWAQTHGGPWPSTNTLHTSVGTSAIRRFLRPLTWQDAPDAVLPEELRDGYDDIPRRVDGIGRPAGAR